LNSPRGPRADIPSEEKRPDVAMTDAGVVVSEQGEMHQDLAAATQTEQDLQQTIPVAQTFANPKCAVVMDGAVQKASDRQAGILEAIQEKQSLLAVHSVGSGSDNESTTPKPDTSKAGSSPLTAKVNSPTESADHERVGNAIGLSDICAWRGLDAMYGAKINAKVQVNDLLLLSKGQQLGSFNVSDIIHSGRQVRVKLNDSDSKIIFFLNLKNGDSMVPDVEDHMDISMKCESKTLNAFYNHANELSSCTCFKPVERNDFILKMEGTLNDIFNLLKLMYSDPQLFELHHGSNGSASNAQQVLGVARFPTNRADGSVAGGAAEKDSDDSTRDRAFSSASTAASGGQSPPLIANEDAPEPMQSGKPPACSSDSPSNNVTGQLLKPPAFSNDSASNNAMVGPLLKP